ncbi:uncharacterized protein LOC107848975 [Capsicum annuum]|uniref:uncharacterized protein LOC107848975 n=1 Tax=Capsicum annuum TaxID=4072 RepID=UPI001FB07733|nr:uncharacterized protein LOC107848975 [Capsicum annuum]
MCIEGSEYDSVVLTVVETDNQYALYVSEIKVKNFITDCKNIEIMVNQIYKDKETLVSVMARHAIVNGFNTKAKRSNKKKVKPTGSYLYCVYHSKWRYTVDIERGTSNCGRPNTIVKTYELPIVPMPDKKDWNVSFFVDDEVFPPKYRRPPGRPKKRRHLKSSESLSSSSKRCGKCGEPVTTEGLAVSFQRTLDGDNVFFLYADALNGFICINIFIRFCWNVGTTNI